MKLEQLINALKEIQEFMNMNFKEIVKVDVYNVTTKNGEKG